MKGPVVTEINKDTFWELIDQAKKQPHDPSDWLMAQLVSMGPEQARKFDTISRVYVDLAYQYGLWTAASVMEKFGCTDDGFIDFREWLVAQGKEVYMAALKDPDTLADASSYQEQQFDFLPHIGSCAYEELTGRDVYQDFNPVQYQTLKSEIQPDIVYGDGICYPYTWSKSAAYIPRLCAKYLTPEELERRVQNCNDMWNVTCSEIQKARATAQKSKKIKKNRGDSR